MNVWLVTPSRQRRVRAEPRNQVQQYAGKRMLDVVIASVLLVVLSPLMLVAFVAVRLTSPGGAVFRQVRVGALGRRFVLLKFRTMQSDCSQASHEDFVRQMMTGELEPPCDGVYKLRSDPRITWVGALLRRASIDELPQLVNVLRGEMSLVGPRPVLPWEADLFPAAVRSRFLVPPGLTGLWQISGRNRLTMLEGLRLDVEYVSRCTLTTDLQIMARTPVSMLRGGAR